MIARRQIFGLVLCGLLGASLCGCGKRERKKITVGSKFFTEQVILAELVAQEIEAKAGLPVERKSNLGGTMLVQKAMLAGEVDVYVEYTGTALTAVLGEKPEGSAEEVYRRVQAEYAKRFQFAVLPPLGFENTFAMVIRGNDAEELGLVKMSDLGRVARKWRAGVGYEFLERPDGYRGWTERYGLEFDGPPKVMDLGLIYRALAEKQVDVVAGNSTDGLIEALGLAALEDDRHYFPPYDAVPVAREATLREYPKVREALESLAGKISATEMRKLNYAVDGEHRNVADVVREFRKAKGL